MKNDKTVTASRARTTLPTLLDRAESGEELAITRYGAPVATLGPVQNRRTLMSGIAKELNDLRRGQLLETVTLKELADLA
ncbi:MAG TPA: type II toxin-antitoxin system Phd/YefM family antitoxin [Fimbriimonadales bacterium]|nr:type II toxin-antitoxin system Phd/YefM family antitoxin [Fimbriimonadales bacterium]